MNRLTRNILQKHNSNVYEKHMHAHEAWKAMCDQLERLRSKSSHTLLVAHAYNMLCRIRSFNENDLPPFARTSLKREIIQAYMKLSKRNEALTASSNLLRELKSADELHLITAQQTHGFILLDNGTLDDAKEAYDLFNSTINGKDNAETKNQSPLFWIDYQRLIPISKVGLGISLLHMSSKTCGYSMSNGDSCQNSASRPIPPQMVIERYPDAEKALKLLYDTLPLLYENEEDFYAALSLFYISLVHESCKSKAKAIESLCKLKSWIDGRPKIQKDIRFTPADVSLWLERVQLA